jgi:hypothetical protein
MGLKSAPICVEDVGNLKRKYGATRVMEQVRQGPNLALVGPRNIYENSKCKDCRLRKDMVREP